MEENKQKQPVGKCPACKRNVYEGSKHFYCEDRQLDGNGCNFVIWKNSLIKLGKAEITNEEMKILLSGKSIELSLVSKEGKKFTSKGTIENNKKWGWGIKLNF